MDERSRVRYSVSLFCGAGIGDVGLRAAGIEPLVMNEIESTPAAVARRNFPGAVLLEGDILSLEGDIVRLARQQLEARDAELFLVSCTAPCQGMSKNGQGTLLRNIREGRRPKLDPRNRLVLPALRIIRSLQPQYVIFENVSEMANTVIEDDDGQLLPILDVIKRGLPDYAGQVADLELADFGIPQRRRRLITVYTRSASARQYQHLGGDLVPPVTHAAKPTVKLAPWVPVSEVLKHFPPLDAACVLQAQHPHLPFHRVPVLDERKYRWVAATRAGSTAFDNQCDTCGSTDNPTHAARRNSEGINRASDATPIHLSLIHI